MLNIALDVFKVAKYTSKRIVVISGMTNAAEK